MITINPDELVQRFLKKYSNSNFPNLNDLCHIGNWYDKCSYWVQTNLLMMHWFLRQWQSQGVWWAPPQSKFKCVKIRPNLTISVSKWQFFAVLFSPMDFEKCIRISKSVLLCALMWMWRVINVHPIYDEMSRFEILLFLKLVKKMSRSEVGNKSMVQCFYSITFPDTHYAGWNSQHC